MNKLLNHNHSVMRRLITLPWDEAGWKAVIEELHSRRKMPPAELGDIYRRTAHDMTNTYATKAPIRAISDGFYSSTMKASPTFAFCFTMGGAASLHVAVQRALAASVGSAQSITTELVPLFEELVTLPRRYHASPAYEPFASAIRQILLAWTSLVLGSQPSKTASVPALEAILAQYQCMCEDCLRVKTFLRGNSASFDLWSIGAQRRMHVEKELSSRLDKLVRYIKIDTRPQGLTVRSDALLSQENSDAWNRF
jgi:hypothetical protein